MARLKAYDGNNIAANLLDEIKAEQSPRKYMCLLESSYFARLLRLSLCHRGIHELFNREICEFFQCQGEETFFFFSASSSFALLSSFLHLHHRPISSSLFFLFGRKPGVSTGVTLHKTYMDTGDVIPKNKRCRDTIPVFS